MKKLLSIVLAAALFITMCGCMNREPNAKVRAQSEAEKVMSDLVSPIYSKSRVYLDTRNESAVPSFAICVSDPDYNINKNQKLEQLRLKLKEKQYKPNLRILYVPEKYVDADPQIVFDGTIRNLALLYGDFTLDKNFEYENIYWYIENDI